MSDSPHVSQSHYGSICRCLLVPSHHQRLEGHFHILWRISILLNELTSIGRSFAIFLSNVNIFCGTPFDPQLIFLGLIWGHVAPLHDVKRRENYAIERPANSRNSPQNQSMRNCMSFLLVIDDTSSIREPPKVS
jgi:hypothetical protein